MGTEKGLDCQHQRVTLYTAQTDAVVAHLMEQGRHYAKRSLIAQKYREVSSVFLDAYAWFTRSAQMILPADPQAESPVWAFFEAKYLEQHEGHRILKLSVPMDQAVFFRMSDWSKRLNLRYIGKTAQEEQAFSQKLEQYGIAYEGDVYSKPFYPHLKKELTESWKNLFRYDEVVKQNGDFLYPDMQAALWYIDRDWIEN